MTYNIEDLRHKDIKAALRGEKGPGPDRVLAAAELIAAVNPDVLFVQELEHPETPTGAALPDSSSASDFADILLTAQSKLGIQERKYGFFQRSSNTGVPSGKDLDRNGKVVLEPGSEEYGHDCFGFGVFPGQYAMALLVGEPFAIDSKAARTFQTLLRAEMPGALLSYGDNVTWPLHKPWYDADMLSVLRLSSKSHWDVPVLVPDPSGEGSRTIRAHLSHPTPPQYTHDTAMRGHDEIRFWASYADGDSWIRDDSGVFGGASREPAVIMGDLNADSRISDAIFDPVGMWLWQRGRYQRHVPSSKTTTKDTEGRVMSADATTVEGFRLDYLLPTPGLIARRGAVLRGRADLPEGSAGGATLLFNSSDHFPVWTDFELA